MPYTLVSNPGGTAKPDGESLPDPQKNDGEETARLEALLQQMERLQAEIDALRGRPDTPGAQPQETAANPETAAARPDEKDRIIHDLLVRNAFFSSDFLREKTVLPPEFAYARFAKNFTVKIEGGNPVVIATYDKGGTIFSRKAPGKPAEPEEAIAILIEQHPQRDALIKAAAPAGGSGALPHAKGSGGRLLPDQISRLSLADYAKARKEGRI